MKIKIGDKIYDGNKEPIMIILTKQDKQNITNMLPKATKYCCYPDGMDRKIVRKWMASPKK